MALFASLQRVNVPLENIQGALSHQLAHAEPSPTQLAAAAISSPVFTTLPFTLTKLQTFSTCFRHALHIKFKLVNEPMSFPERLFSLSSTSRIQQWTASVIKGLQGGHPLLRLASYSGLLMALEDLRVKENLVFGIRDTLESEAVVSLAEVMDLYRTEQQPSSSYSMDWEQDWNKSFPSAEGVDVLSLALILSSQSMILVAPQRLEALPLTTVLQVLSSTIASAFSYGTFLSSLAASCSSTATHQVYISPKSPLSHAVESVSSSPVMTSIASLSKLTASALSLLLGSRPKDGVSVAEDILQLYCTMSQRIAADWKGSVLSTVSQDSISPQSRNLIKSIWSIFKTMLFSMIMVSEAVLSSIVFVSPQVYFLHNNGPTPSSLALVTLRTLSYLSPVVSQFGLFTTTRSSDESFKELKKTFYIALDILADGKVQAERFVRDACVQSEGLASDQTKKAFLLACIEQLVPALSADCIQNIVFPFCEPHLYDSVGREIYEMAHSVILAIFAATTSNSNVMDSEFTRFAESSVSFYTPCLIENSQENRLNTAQLRLAYSALVRSASTCEEPSNEYPLTRYCVDSLVNAIQHEKSGARLHRLHLMLVSSIPSLPLPLLPAVMEEVRRIILSVVDTERKELVDSLFLEIIENVGDREKEFLMRWWFERSSEFSKPVKPELLARI